MRWTSKNTNLITRKYICDKFLVPLDGLSRPCPHCWTEKTKTATCRQDLPRNHTRNNAHFQITNMYNHNKDKIRQAHKIALSFPSKQIKAQISWPRRERKARTQIFTTPKPIYQPTDWKILVTTSQVKGGNETSKPHQSGSKKIKIPRWDN